MPDRLSREEHALRHGPTAGDRVRLADTDLWLRIEEDLTEPGDQALWGYAKNWRSRMTQHDAATTASELDTVIGSVLVVDPLLGIVKCDLGIKDGRVAGIGRAGNPDITDGVDLTIGPNTWPIPCHGLIATPAVVDSHVHLLSPRLVPVALSAGVTTSDHGRVRGATRPDARARFAAFERLPVNVGLQPSARTDVAGGLDPAIEAGACGLKIHEDWGAYPEIIDATLRAAEAHDIAVCLHTDSLNESTELEGTVEAIAGRTVHAYHVEGSGGGHIPDAIGLVREPNIICSSTTPTLPYGPSTADEQLDMKLIVHEGNPFLPDDVVGGTRAGPPGDDGGRGTAARPRRDPDRELRLAGHGPDRRDPAPNDPARPRDEGVARGCVVGRRTSRSDGCARPSRPTTASPTTTSERSATWRSARSSRPSSTASRTRSARSPQGGWPTSCCGKRRGSA